MQRRRRVSEIIEAGAATDFVSRGCDVVSTLILLEGDHVILYSQERISNANLIEI